MTPFNQPISTYDNWGIDPSYMTPAYMANFRPQYGDDGDYMNPYSQNRSLAQSAWMGIGPGAVPFGSDPFQQIGAAKQDLANAPGDALMSGLQSVAIPLASWYMADKLIGSTGIGRAVGAGMGRGASRVVTGMAGGLLSRVPGVGAVARGLGAMGAGNAMAGGAAALGGLAGSMFLPLAAGAAIGTGVEKGIVDPFVATRRSTEAMRANVANQYVGGAGGATTDGFGMSAVRAAEISSELTKASAMDTAFDVEEYGKLADFGMRSGLFQEMGDLDTKNIVDGVKGLADLVQSITTVTGDPDFKNAIGIVSKLKAGGLDDLVRMNTAVKQIGAASAASGVSADQIINTVGNQGMVMAQQEGMTGVTGLLASADAFAGFTNARKAGLISGATMGALGGVEGMTQNVMSGAMKALDSGYGRMTIQSDGRMGDDVNESIARWGTQFAEDPMVSMGDWNLNQGVDKDRTMREQGASNVIMSHLQAMARNMGLDEKNVNVLAALAPSMNISNEEFRSAAIQNKNMSDSVAQERMRGAREAKRRQDTAAQLVTDGYSMAGIPLIGDAQQFITNTGAQMQSGMSNVGNYVAGVGASVSDSWDRFTAEALGIGMKDSIRTRVESPEGVTSEYSLKGGRIAGANMNLREGTLANMKDGGFIQNNDFETEIGNIMQLTQSRDPDVRNKALEVVKMLEGTEGRTAENSVVFKKALADLDKMSGNMITGTDNAMDRNDELNRITQEGYTNERLRAEKKTVKGTESQLASAVAQYNSYGSGTGTSYSTEDEYLGGKEISGFSVKERAGLLQQVFGAAGDATKLNEFATQDFGADREKIGRMFKIDKSIVDNYENDPAAFEAALAKRATEMSTEDIGDIETDEQLRERILLQTGDAAFADKLLADGNGELIRDLVNDDLGGALTGIGIGDNNTNVLLQERIKDQYASYKGFETQDKQAQQAQDMGIDTSGIRDLAAMGDTFQGISKANNDNTAAVNKLTETLNKPVPGSVGAVFKAASEAIQK